VSGPGDQGTPARSREATDAERHPLAWLGTPAVWAIRLYRLALSPIVGNQCRHWPTCSRYGIEAFQTHHPARAAWLTARRIARCHPWGKGGVDPVPPVGRDEANRAGGASPADADGSRSLRTPQQR
jgi:hypothetical protein